MTNVKPADPAQLERYKIRPRNTQPLDQWWPILHHRESEGHMRKVVAFFKKRHELARDFVGGFVVQKTEVDRGEGVECLREHCKKGKVLDARRGFSLDVEVADAGDNFLKNPQKRLKLAVVEPKTERKGEEANCQRLLASPGTMGAEEGKEVGRGAWTVTHDW